ncbi:MAG: acetyl-CoA C-acetyltransferase [Bacilli bacterium]|nr:acetyl-CoA C-acetyltransferase [Bacilli bacterium]
MSKVYIVAAKRTATGVQLGTLKDVKAPLLGAAVVKQMLADVKLDPKNVDEVFFGEIFTAGVGGGPARQTAIYAGIPNEITASAVNMLCASGMKAIIHGFTYIKAGFRDVVVAGGQESMTQAPYLIPGVKARSGIKMGDWKVQDHMLYDGLVDIFYNYHMGVTAENIAKQYGITRQEQDEFAWNSTVKAIKAIDNGVFDPEIVPIPIKTKKGEILFSRDETANRTTSLEKMGALKPAFSKDGTITAATSSSINDGASGVILMSEEACKKYNCKPLVEVISFGQAGVDPSVMGLGPVPAIRDALKRAKMELKQMDLIELNEAFAAQSIACIRDLAKEHGVSKEWIMERCNVNGGAIALGHAVGSSGSRITVTLIHELKRRNGEYGIASLCVGGGMGATLIVKNVK